MSDEVPIIFPIETTVRELDSRLVLAALHAHKDARVFIAGGPAGQRLIREVSGAVVVGKHMIHPTAAEPRAYFDAKKNGSVVVHLAEEGAIFQGKEADWDWDLDDQLLPKLLDPEDFVCTWGDYQRDYYLSQSPPTPRNIRTTGHPRFDVYKSSLSRLYEDEAAALRARHGDFVIMCSNFSFATDAEGPWNTFSKPLGYDPSNEETLMRFLGRWGHTCKTFPDFVELYHRLARKRRDLTFIVRPHPSDSISYFKYAFGGVPNIKVIQEGSVVPWLLAARVMLHAGCTTAIEAHLVGCPIVNFRPLGNVSHDHFVPNLFGAQCLTMETAMEAIESAASKPREASATPADAIPERAHRIFGNFRLDSIDLFLSVLREAEDLARSRPRPPLNRARLRMNEARAIAVEESKHLVRRAVLRTNYLTAMHERQRFGGFDRAAIRTKLDKLQELTGNALEVQFHSRNVLELSSKNARRN
jgi:surface carbohydrate biosynthesis protein